MEKKAIQPTREHVSAAIRAEMAAQGITQTAMSECVDVNRANLNRQLQGRTAMSLDVFCQIADALGLTPAELMAQAQARAEREARRG